MGHLARSSGRCAFRAPVRPGWHRHHLLPNHVRRYHDLDIFLRRLDRVAAIQTDFATNGMYLPCEEGIAAPAHLPLHRGPHLTYNAIVVQALDTLHQDLLHWRASLDVQLAAVRGLQRRLKSLLQLSALDAEVALASRDPFGPIPAAAALDRQTDALFAESERQCGLSSTAPAPGRGAIG